MNFVLLAILLSAFCQRIAEAANIFITLISASESQNLMVYNLAEMLGKRDHRVTIFKRELFPEAKTVEKLENVKEIVHKITNDSDILNELREGINSAPWFESKINIKQMLTTTRIFRTLSSNCDTTLQDEHLLNRLKSDRYDVIVIHTIDFCSFGIAHHLDIKGVIWMSTPNLVDFMAWYANSSKPYVINAVNTMLNKKMKFLDRFQNTLMTTFAQAIFQYGVISRCNDLFINRFGSTFLKLDQLLANKEIFYINSDSVFEFPRPVSRNVIFVGGLTIQNAEPLNEKWQQIVDNAGDAGVIICSLNSVANNSTMTIAAKKAFVNVFKSVSQKVIWKLQADASEAEAVPNIYVSNCLPQKDLLGSAKVKALITNCDYNVLTEAIHFGVPLVMFPLFGGQHANCKRVALLKVGVILSRGKLSEDLILKALKSVMYNETMQSNARRLGRMIRSKPGSSLELAVKRIEFLADFYLWDKLTPTDVIILIAVVVIYFLLLFLLVCCIVFKVCKCCYRKLRA